MLKKWFGDKAFYRYVLSLAIPIMIQNGITNFVNMLDNVMVGQVGTVEMTGVAVANQLIFVFNLCIFGAVSGAGIFGAQFHGNNDHVGVRDTLRFKLLFCTAMTVLGMVVLGVWGEPLINLYLQGEGNLEDAAASLSFAKQYVGIMLIGLIPYSLTQCYSSTLRETGKTLPPMVAGLVAVFVNLALNAILIFGLLGFPKLGVAGAAIATVISRFAELAIVGIWTHVNRAINPFVTGLYRSMRVPRALIAQIAAKGLPLMANETLWAAGIAMVNQCYSAISLDVVAANNIGQTFFNVFGTAFLSMGAAIGIILGQKLGANAFDDARSDATKLITFSVCIGIAVGAVYFVCAEWIPLFYNTTDTIRETATRLMQIAAVVMPLDAFVNSSYFTLRSGGKTFATFLFDSVFVWAVNVPVAFVLAHYTDISVLWVYGAVQATNLIKCIIGGTLVGKGIWLRNIVETK